MSNIEIIVKKLIDIYVKDADVYVNNGSLWLIFTEEKKWVIELDNAGNLWYNYHFFYNIFKLISMNVVENQHYITRWVEDALQNGVNNTDRIKWNVTKQVEDALQNGVKHTSEWESESKTQVEDALQNGVKETLSNFISSDVCVEDIIQNGVKGTKIQELDTWDIQKCRVKEVEDIIQNVVKDTKNLQWMKTTLIEDAVQNGVKI